jgi:hypothetical protein
MVSISYPNTYPLAASAPGATYSNYGGNHQYVWYSSGSITF